MIICCSSTENWRMAQRDHPYGIRDRWVLTFGQHGNGCARWRLFYHKVSSGDRKSVGFHVHRVCLGVSGSVCEEEPCLLGWVPAIPYETSQAQSLFGVYAKSQAFAISCVQDSEPLGGLGQHSQTLHGCPAPCCLLWTRGRMVATASWSFMFGADLRHWRNLTRSWCMKSVQTLLLFLLKSLSQLEWERWGIIDWWVNLLFLLCKITEEPEAI